ncbi:cystathionine beta-lyase [Falsiroseomonas sp. HW251]|uniref:cystathionine beta-lyase n=1 Tax=Falsiroseomonas sp. HW251 TaxID=3390998 RepID=UPI003D315FAA
MDHVSRTPSLATRLTQLERTPAGGHGFVNPPVHRGSTVLQPDVAARDAANERRLEPGAMSYGTQGGPTQHALERIVADIEGGVACTVVGTGLAAISVPLMAFLRAGDHLLMADSVYGPARRLAAEVLPGFGVETSFYDPCTTPEALAPLFRPNTRVLYLESPGSYGFEMQDVPALAALARARGAVSMIDNTWGLANFQPFEKGCDVSIQALTKYLGGHSDVLLGSVTVADMAHHRTIRAMYGALGHYAAPDDCWLAIRGARTLALRLKQQEAAALEVARWLQGRPQVARVLHPALPGDPGHAIWKRDFSGACSLFGVVFQPRYTREDAVRFVDGLKLFGIGASWGGYESLALPMAGTRSVSPRLPEAAVRLHVGLEDVADLLADLDQGLARLG